MLLYREYRFGNRYHSLAESVIPEFAEDRYYINTMLSVYRSLSLPFNAMHKSRHKVLVNYIAHQTFHIKYCYGWKAFYGSLNLLLHKAGFLTYRSSLDTPSHIPSGIQWSLCVSLPVYSDRIAQDSHLIPFSPKSLSLTM